MTSPRGYPGDGAREAEGRHDDTHDPRDQHAGAPFIDSDTTSSVKTSVNRPDRHTNRESLKARNREAFKAVGHKDGFILCGKAALKRGWVYVAREAFEAAAALEVG